MNQKVGLHWVKDRDTFSGLADAMLIETYPLLEGEIENLLVWISKDDGTGLYGAEVEWAIKDLIESSVRVGISLSSEEEKVKDGQRN